MLAQELRVLVSLLHTREDEQDLVGAPQRRGCLVNTRKNGDLDASGEVFDLREHHQLLVLGDVLAGVRHDAGDGHEVVLSLSELRERDEVLHVFHPRSEGVQGVCGQVDSE